MEDITTTTSDPKSAANGAKDDDHIRCCGVNFTKFHGSMKAVCFPEKIEEMNRDETTTTKDYCLLALRDVFLDNIPYGMTQEFSTGKRYLVGIVSYLIYWGLFIFFFRSTYLDQTQDSPYFSTSYDKDFCDQIPVKFTDSYYLDYDGLWEGKTNFAFYASPYRFQFTEFSVSSENQYSQMMQTYKSAIDTIGNYSKTQPLAVNLVLWMSYIRYYYLTDPSNTTFNLIGADNLQYMEFTGDPSVIFKAPYHQALVSSYAGVCNFTGLLTSYSQSDALYRVEMNKNSVHDMIANPGCLAATSTSIFAPSYGKLDRSYHFELDVRSFSTALAVNMGFIELTSLGWSHTKPTVVTLPNGNSYTIGEYFDTRYRMMEPITCISDTFSISSGTASINPATNLTMNDLCLIRYGNSLFLPIFNHLGGSFEKPQECTCQKDMKSNDVCNQFHLIPSLLFYKSMESADFDPSSSSSTGSSSSSSSSSLKQVVKLLALRQRYVNYMELNADAYNASASATIKFLGHDHGAVNMDQTWFTEAYDFCANTNSNGTEYCSMITFASLNSKYRRISPYHYELLKGHCTNSFSALEDDEWERAFQPPLDLYESYYVCTQDTLNAVINAIGLATGNIAIFFLVIFALSVPFVYIYLTCIYQPKDPETKYSPDAIKACLENFGTMLYHYAELKDKKNETTATSSTSPSDSAGDSNVPSPTATTTGATSVSGKRMSITGSSVPLWEAMNEQDVPTIAHVVDEIYKFLGKPTEIEEKNHQVDRKPSLSDKWRKRFEDHTGWTCCCANSDDKDGSSSKKEREGASPSSKGLGVPTASGSLDYNNTTNEPSLDIVYRNKEDEVVVREGNGRGEGDIEERRVPSSRFAQEARRIARTRAILRHLSTPETTTVTPSSGSAANAAGPKPPLLASRSLNSRRFNGNAYK